MVVYSPRARGKDVNHRTRFNCTIMPSGKTPACCPVVCGIGDFLDGLDCGETIQITSDALEGVAVTGNFGCWDPCGSQTVKVLNGQITLPILNPNFVPGDSPDSAGPLVLVTIPVFTCASIPQCE